MGQWWWDGELATSVPASGGLDRGTAVLAIAAVAVFAFLVNVVVRPYLHRRPRRRPRYGPDDLGRVAPFWKEGLTGGWGRHERSQMHDGPERAGPARPGRLRQRRQPLAPPVKFQLARCSDGR